MTEAVIKVRPYAQVHEYDSVVFPSFEEGVKFMHDLVKNRVYPASVRLVDNLQFRFAIAFTGSSKGAIKLLLSKIAKFYLTTIRGYDPFKLCVATLLFEGSQSEVDYQKTHLYRIAKEHNGTRGGPENGKRGYNLTFLIAYIRDFVMSHNFIAESLETSVPWSNVLTLCDSTRKQIFESTKKYGIKSTPIVTFRVTLLYETVIPSLLSCGVGRNCLHVLRLQHRRPVGPIGSVREDRGGGATDHDALRRVAVAPPRNREAQEEAAAARDVALWSGDPEEAQGGHRSPEHIRDRQHRDRDSTQA